MTDDVEKGADELGGPFDLSFEGLFSPVFVSFLAGPSEFSAGVQRLPRVGRNCA